MGNSPVTGEFPAQRASNAQNVSIWWCHHDIGWASIVQVLQWFQAVLEQHCCIEAHIMFVTYLCYRSMIENDNILQIAGIIRLASVTMMGVHCQPGVAHYVLWCNNRSHDLTIWNMMTMEFWKIWIAERSIPYANIAWGIHFMIYSYRCMDV